MKTEDQKAYMKGYAAGSRAAWPAHRPPLPPDEITAAFLTAALALRDAAQDVVGALMAEDEFSLKLEPHIQAVNEAAEKLTQWLRSAPPRQ